MKKRNFKKQDIYWYIFIGILILIPLIPKVAGNTFIQHVLILILLYASMSQAWNIIGGYCGQVSFGHSVFFGIGAYGAAMAVVKYGMVPWLGVLVGAVTASIVAILISYPCFKLKGHYFAIATFAIVEIFNRLFMVWDWVEGALGLDYPLVEEGWKNFMWYETKIHYYYGALILFVIIFSVVRYIEQNRFGFYLKAVREDQETAESTGINSTLVKLMAMGISAFLAALCGAFFAQYSLRVAPPMVICLSMSMTFVLVTILGGAGTFFGPLLGAMILIPLQEYTRVLWGGLGSGIDLILFGFLIVLIMVRQPKGIMGLINEFLNYKKNRKQNFPESQVKE
ncbi:MAG: branched-chain amino acid ABC transporter permease [Candidatus Caldatribacteriota bacterium]|nr:branched-chain amino acid ABC transporter permease [Candidatus Caldatribacteriota bacterium]